jgi:signal transduction histidine kinase
MVLNLLDNVLKFSYEGEVVLAAVETAVGVSVSATDPGEGIASEDQARILDDFVRVRNLERDTQEGFGLGLAIAERLASHLGDHLTVEIERGRESRFSLHLPSPVRVEPPRPGEPSGGASPGSREPAAPSFG